MAIKCSNCNGNLIYSIKEKKLRCEHCGNVFEVEDVCTIRYSETEEDYTDNPQITTITLKCAECGAELRSFKEEQTVHCPYCGKQILRPILNIVHNHHILFPSKLLRMI